MPLGKGQRRILYILGIILGGLLVLGLSLPVWLPWVLRPVARHLGAGFASYQRKGYRHLVLQDVTYTNQTLRFRANRLEATMPSLWGWRGRARRGKETQPFVRTEGWQLELLGKGKTPTSAYQEYEKLRQGLARFAAQVPSAALTNGTVFVNGKAVPVPSLAWAQSKVQALVELPGHHLTTLTGHLGPAQSFALGVHSASLHLQTEARFTLSPQALEVQSTGTWWSNRVELAAGFGPQGWWPTQARLQAPAFELPAALLDIEGYRDLRGSLAARWEQGRFGLDLGAQAQPQAERVRLPPVRLDLHASGDTNAVTIQSARVSSPGLQAALSRELQLHFTGPLLREPGTLHIAVDLSRQTVVPLQGQLTGEADFVPTATRLPATYFHLTGAGVGTTELKTQSLKINGHLNWPWLDITSANGEFEDGSVASGKGQLEVVTETIQGGRFHLNGPLLERWLPPGWQYQALSLTGEVHGPLRDPLHSGQVELTHLRSPALRPLQVRVDWSGQSQALQRAELAVSAGHASLAAHGALALGSRESLLQLTQLSFATNGSPLLELVKPCRIAVSQAGTGKAWQLTITPLDLAGKAGEAHLQGTLTWPGQGTLQVALQDFSSSLLSGFSQATVPEVQIQKLRASATWTNGPATLALEVAATHAPPAAPEAKPGGPRELRSLLSRPFSLALKVAGNQTGLLLSNLVVSSQGSPLASAHGLLPLTLNPSTPKALIQLEAHKPLQFEAAAQPQAFLWDELTAWTGVALRAPSLKFQVTGSWEAPTGQIDLHAQELQFQQGPTNLPALQDLQVVVKVDRGKVQLTEGRVFVQGQPVLLTADLPLDKRFWNEWEARLVHGTGPRAPTLWRDYYEPASAHVLIANAQLAAFSELFPKILSPEGELSLDFSVRPGLRLEGHLVLSHARTRPLGNAGPLRNVEVRMRFADRALELEHASAGVGGTTLLITGAADLRGTAWLGGALPPFQFRLYGTNVPLARQSSAILRSDLNLAITKTNGAPPLISGRAHLRDSYFLTDLAALVPRTVSTPARRPPYFSVSDPMLADWRLWVRVEGSRFLRVLSPLFTGEVSADLNLQGTLKDPIALGDLKTDSGVVRFPFANFQVRQGLVTLTSQDPYRPQLFAMGESRQFGYDLRMEVSGPVDTPVLQFASTPPLASEQILLMVTAGELPRGELTLTSQQKAQTMAMFLGRDLLAKLGLGDQTEQRLSIHSNEEVSQVGRSTYNVEYRLSKRWSVEGEYDRFGDFNAGFKWRIYSK